ncbi:MAG: hypothetical protein EOP45_01840 [Sphingobacteriaceae bacterium]|nr:MAG: hypothetical protein EOP45_01840 [Sphingobacteriaceae bacterium]
MRNFLFTALAGYCLLVGRVTFAQDLGFEKPDAGNHGLPTGLSINGSGFDVRLDAAVKHSGKYALQIASKTDAPDNSYSSAGYTVPGNLSAKKLVLKGWIKTSGISGTGRAALWLRADGDKGVLAMDNMMVSPVADNIDWTQFSVTVPYDSNVKKIVFGGMLFGKGSAWFDDLELVPVAEKDIPPPSGRSSGVADIPYNTNNLKNLFLVCKVWGLLKYFHPQVAQGKQDWDAALFTELKQVQQAPDTFDAEMVRWVTSLGDLPECRPCKPAETDTLLRKNNWIEHWGLSPGLVVALKIVIARHNTGSNRYVGLYPGTQNPDFKGEASYTDVDNPDAGFRLLALFRFWNMVNYYYPYKHLIGTDWDITLVRMIPDFLKADTRLDYKLAVWRMVSNIHDTHANIYTHRTDNDMLKFLGGDRQLPVGVSYVENQWVVTRVFDSSNSYVLNKGDVITHINDIPITQRVAKLKPYASASNDAAANRNIASDLFWTSADTLKLQVIRNNKHLTLSVPTVSSAAYYKRIADQQAAQKQSISYKLINSRVGYVSFAGIKSSSFDDMFKAFKDTKGIVMDLRNYPSEFIVFSLNEYLRNKPAAFVKFKHPVADKPGMLEVTEEIKVGKENNKSYKGKIVILVNEQTQSQAEYTTMSLQAGGRAIVMGSQTAGADGNVSGITFPGGLNTFFSGLGVLYPDGKETQRIGIDLDTVFCFFQNTINLSSIN